jgi:hypothetical protein
MIRAAINKTLFILVIISREYSQVEMLPLETKRSGGKLLPHSVYIRGGGCFWRKYHAAGNGKGLFCAELFIFQFAIQKFKNKDTQNYNIARCSVWV